MITYYPSRSTVQFFAPERSLSKCSIATPGVGDSIRFGAEQIRVKEYKGNGPQTLRDDDFKGRVQTACALTIINCPNLHSVNATDGALNIFNGTVVQNGVWQEAQELLRIVNSIVKGIADSKGSLELKAAKILNAEVAEDLNSNHSQIEYDANALRDCEIKGGRVGGALNAGRNVDAENCRVGSIFAMEAVNADGVTADGDVTGKTALVFNNGEAGGTLSTDGNLKTAYCETLGALQADGDIEAKEVSVVGPVDAGRRAILEGSNAPQGITARTELTVSKSDQLGTLFCSKGNINAAEAAVNGSVKAPEGAVSLDYSDIHLKAGEELIAGQGLIMRNESEINGKASVNGEVQVIGSQINGELQVQAEANAPILFDASKLRGKLTVTSTSGKPALVILKNRSRIEDITFVGVPGIVVQESSSRAQVTNGRVYANEAEARLAWANT